MWLHIAFYTDHESRRMGKKLGISDLRQKILHIHGNYSILWNLHTHGLFVSENFQTSLPESFLLVQHKQTTDKYRTMTNKCLAAMQLILKGIPWLQKYRSACKYGIKTRLEKQQSKIKYTKCPVQSSLSVNFHCGLFIKCDWRLIKYKKSPFMAFSILY
jgi:hypothetical protein